MTLKLRDYQSECVSAIESSKAKRMLCQLFTGAGKTVIFSQLPRQGPMLIGSHTEELTDQPVKYFDVPVGIERANHRPNGEEIISASIQSLVKRLDDYAPDYFDTIVIDECHHASAETYQKILAHFTPRRLIGFTATPNRADGVGLSSTFDEIVFSRDIRWGMENEWLANLTCKRVHIGFDLCGVRSQGGDYEKGALAKACDIPECVQAIAQAARDIAEPPVLIFAVNVANAQHIAEELKGVCLHGGSKDREKVVASFRAGQIPYLVNCQLFTEGFDAPETKTIMVARPTQSMTLYTQIVGRGLRRTATKTRAILIDCVGASKLPLCTAPSLLGLDLSMVPAARQMELEGDLMAELPAKVEIRSDCPDSWIRNVQIVDLWAKTSGVDTHGVMWFRCADGRMVLPLPNSKWIRITPANLRGECEVQNHAGYSSGLLSQQKALDAAYAMLCKHAQNEKTLWSKRAAQRWGKGDPTARQIALIAGKAGIDPRKLTRLEASRVITRLMM